MWVSDRRVGIPLIWSPELTKGKIVKKASKTLIAVTASIALTFGLFSAPANSATISGILVGSEFPLAPDSTNRGSVDLLLPTSATTLAGTTITVELVGASVNTPESISNAGCVFFEGSWFNPSFPNGTSCVSRNAGGNAIFEFTTPSFPAGSWLITLKANAFKSVSSGSSQTFTITSLSSAAGSLPDTGTASLNFADTTPNSTSTATPTPSATPTPTTSSTPAKGTAAALAELPKSSTQPKLKFATSDNGLSSASKKSLKKVAEVAKDGYRVRVTGAAGMQAGVSESAVKALAKKRAMEIRAYLIKQGVPKEDIFIKTKIFPIGMAPTTLVKAETLS